MDKEIKNVICPKCGCTTSYVYRINGFEGGECTNCGELTYTKEIGPHIFNNKPTVKCQYCGSSDTRKISTASKIGNFALFGVFAIGKNTKQWHCNHCKSDF